MWNLKKKIPETSDYNKEEADSQTQRTEPRFTVGGQDRGRRMRGTGYWASGRLEDLLCKMGETASFLKKKKNNCKWKITF